MSTLHFPFSLLLCVPSACGPVQAPPIPAGDAREVVRDPGPAAEAAELVGSPAPDWGERVWAQGGPLSLSGLRGRPVLLRWWTEGCPYCENSAPALRELRARYRDRGLVVVGVYHPKPPRDVSAADARRAALRLGLDFAVTLDNDWSLLKRYWLDRRPRGWTSVTFLLDRRGVIRHVHPGGEYHAGGGPGHEACAAEYLRLREAIETVLGESP